MGPENATDYWEGRWGEKDEEEHNVQNRRPGGLLSATTKHAGY